ncbi:Plasma kallikrein [Bulinus truncatus]|nr:Plasma kallikrein [Bulinus truncatus]
MVGAFTGRDGAAIGKDGAVTGRDGAFTGRDGAVVGRDGAVTGRDGAVTGRDGAATYRDGAFTGRDGAVVGRDGAVTGRDGAVTGRDGAATYRDGAFTGRDGAVVGRDGAVTGRDGEATGMVGAFNGRDGAAIGRDGAVTGRDGAVTGRDGAVTGMVGAFTGRDGAAISRFEMLFMSQYIIKSRQGINHSVYKLIRMKLRKGATFGLSPDNTFIWVRGLCQAEFLVESNNTNTVSPVNLSTTVPTVTKTTRQGSGNSYEACGVPNHYRIIGGTNATACEYPWMVLIINPFSNVSCGGAIIDANHILTASHCFFSVNKRTGTYIKTNATQIVVLTGTSSMPFQTFNIPGLRLRSVAKLITHENYNWKTLANDIAIVKLTEPIQFDGCHRPICLNNGYKNVQQATSCRAMGWGVNTNQPGATKQTVLQWINLPVVSDEVCRRKYRTFASANTFCAGGEGKDTCKGDSGGPFVCSDSDRRFYAYGVVSAGLDSQCGNALGLYTKISSYLPWIIKASQQL